MKLDKKTESKNLQSEYFSFSAKYKEMIVVKKF